MRPDSIEGFSSLLAQQAHHLTYCSLTVKGLQCQRATALTPAEAAQLHFCGLC